MTSILLKGITENPIRGSENRTSLRGIHNLARDVVRFFGCKIIQIRHPTLTISNHQERGTNDSPASHSTKLKFSIRAITAETYMSWPFSRMLSQNLPYNSAVRTFSYDEISNRNASPIKNSIKILLYVSKSSVWEARLCFWGKQKEMKVFEGSEQVPLISMQGNLNNYALPCKSYGTQASGDRS